MCFVYRVTLVLKALWFILSETVNILRKLANCKKITFSGCPRKFYHRVMYIAPSSGHILFNLNFSLKLILRRFEVAFWCLEWECYTFWKTDGNPFKSTNTIYYGFNTRFAIELRWISIVRLIATHFITYGREGFNCIKAQPHCTNDIFIKFYNHIDNYISFFYSRQKVNLKGPTVSTSYIPPLIFQVIVFFMILGAVLCHKWHSKFNILRCFDLFAYGGRTKFEKKRIARWLPQLLPPRAPFVPLGNIIFCQLTSSNSW